MSNGLINLALGLAMQVGSPGPSEAPNVPTPARAYGQYGFEGSAEMRYPADVQTPWVHGYFQEMPAYGGHVVFRPYNYKDVLSQSQTAAGWGERPSMPYSQQFWHKYQDQATMLKVSRSQTVPAPYVSHQQMAPSQMIPTTQGWVAQPGGLQLPAQQVVWPQSANQNTILLPANPPEFQPPILPSNNEYNQLNYRR